jgi:hypothetical protein
MLSGDDLSGFLKGINHPSTAKNFKPQYGQNQENSRVKNEKQSPKKMRPQGPVTSRAGFSGNIGIKSTNFLFTEDMDDDEFREFSDIANNIGDAREQKQDPSPKPQEDNFFADTSMISLAEDQD